MFPLLVIAEETGAMSVIRS